MKKGEFESRTTRLFDVKNLVPQKKLCRLPPQNDTVILGESRDGQQIARQLVPEGINGVAVDLRRVLEAGQQKGRLQAVGITGTVVQTEGFENGVYPRGVE